MQRKALFGNLKVVELGEGISAAFCTKLFADLGAEVIKVEPPGGDLARRRPPFLNDEPGLERSGLFAFLNANKVGVTLDATKRQGYDILVRLLGDADILIENNPPGWMAACGLDYERLQAISPSLIVTSITPFGQDGPWRDYLGNGFIACHVSGFAHENGLVDTDFEAHPPLAIPCSMAEFLGGMTAASATMCALFGRPSQEGRGGGGRHVDVALQEVLANFAAHPIIELTFAGQVPGRKIHPEAKVVIGQQPTADGYIDLTILLEENWRNLMDIMGNPARNNNELFAKGETRAEHASEAFTLVRGETRRFRKQELAELCQARGIPAASVNTVADVAVDGQLQDRAWFGEFDHPVLGHLRCPGPPVKIGDLRPFGERRRPPPLLGEHNREVFGGRLGYSDAELATLHEAGTVRIAGESEGTPLPSFSRASSNPVISPKVAGNNPTSSSLPLEGIRVADFGWVAAAPYGTSLLAEMGAEVIKVEGISRPDISRLYGPYADGTRGLNRSGWFNRFNAGKLSVALELTDPKHLELVKELVAISDVVVENFSHGTMEKLGLGYDVLNRVKPGMVMLSCTGFGRTGQLRAYRAYVSTISAHGGLNSVNGYIGEEPKTPGGVWCDHLAGIALAYAVVAALYQRRETGRGQYIDLSMLEASTSLMGVPFMDYFLNGRIAGRQGNSAGVPSPLAGSASPNNVYRCKGDDAWVALSVEKEEQWDALCQVIDAPELRERPEFSDIQSRSQHTAEIDSRITRWTKERTALEVTVLLQGAGVPCGPSSNAAELLAQPQLRARGFFVEQDHPEVGRRKIPGMPWRFIGDREASCPPAPSYGEHNQYVFGTLLGHSHETIDRLNEQRNQAINSREQQSGGAHRT